MPPLVSDTLVSEDETDHHHHHSNNSLYDSKNDFEDTKASTSPPRKKNKRVMFALEEYNQVFEISSEFTRNVSFPVDEDITEVFEIIHINDLKEETDVTTIWYTPEEYDEMVLNCYETIDRRIHRVALQQQEQHEENSDNDNDDDDDDDDEWCMRGLENELESRLVEYYNDYTPDRALRRQDAVNSVLEEQELQRLEGLHDDKLLADIYSTCSYDSQMEAELVGLEDYRTVLLLEEQSC